MPEAGAWSNKPDGQIASQKWRGHTESNFRRRQRRSAGAT
jgi:hypothetical protein